MSIVRRSVLTALTAFLVMPGSAALAQSGAGDNQYTDPFAGGGGGGHSGSGSGSSGSSSSGGGGSQGSSAGSSSGTQLSTTPPSSGTTSTAPTEQQAAAQNTGVTGTGLPATGGEPGLVALLGAGMLLAGTGLRVRLRAGVR